MDRKDWLDRASEPSHLGGKEYALVWGGVLVALVTLGALAWGAFRLLF